MRLGVTDVLAGGRLVPGDAEVVDGRITAVGLSTGDGRGRRIAVPGLVDLQVNGFGGVDFLDADAGAYRHAGDALVETGVTAYLPTFITAPEERLVEALREVQHAEPGGARILGAHLEGPFLSPARLGTHPPPRGATRIRRSSSGCSTRADRCGSSRSPPSCPALCSSSSSCATAA
jgi:N-acetylglucosamine-6-phosphate deacetylase